MRFQFGERLSHAVGDVADVATQGFFPLFGICNAPANFGADVVECRAERSDLVTAGRGHDLAEVRSRRLPRRFRQPSDAHHGRTRDDNRDGNVNDRPPGVPPNSVVGPKYLDFDFNISKAFFFQGSGGPNVNVFANMTNAFNHVHYGTPSGVLTSPNFGRSTSATEPRQIEIGLRFQF